ncbi:MAG TPA: hypothetical protein VKV17_20690 [Bryobacteraceae bacterium]|nr:hypothetical protein [Bryobacteraceae bacterium]
MASNETDTLIDSFQQAAGDQLWSDYTSLFRSSIGVTLDALVQQAGEIAAGGGQSNGAPSSGQTASEPNVINVSDEAGSRAYTSPTTYAVYRNSSSGSGGNGGDIFSLATSALGGGLGIIPLVTGLMGLFGGSSEPPPLEKYIMPDRLWLTGADTGNGIQEADFDQFGMPRLYSDATSGAGQQLSSPLAAPYSSSGSNAVNAPINVTIQALDSQSFLDRSSDIAQAVRQAMLNSNSINDVVNDL